jgi:hypothetical protein
MAESQPCYSPVLNCKYHDILGDYNNWIIMPFMKCSSISEDDIEDVHNSILINISDKMKTIVTESTYGAVNANDSRTQKRESWMLITKSGDGMIVASVLVINSPNLSSSYIIIRCINAAMFCVSNNYINYF